MSKTIEIGTVFGDLTVIGEPVKNRQKKDVYPCQCICGKVVYVQKRYLVNHNTTRCTDCSLAYRKQRHTEVCTSAFRGEK